jgi:hypothetical protein
MSNKAINLQQPEKVILFDGEEDFVIARGGNNNQYLMVDGAPIGTPKEPTKDIGVSSDTPNSGTGGTVSGGKTPQTDLQFDVPNWSNLTCAELQTQTSNLSSFLLQNKDLITDQRTFYENQLAIGKGTYAQKCAYKEPPPKYAIPDFPALTCENLKIELDKINVWLNDNKAKLNSVDISIYDSAIKNGDNLYKQKCIPQYPKFEIPVWTSLTCDQLKLKIDELTKYLSDYKSKMNSTDASSYDTALINANTLYNQKCKPATPPITTTFLPSLGGAGFFGGGRGGSNLGDEPTTNIEAKTTVKNNNFGKYWWLLVLVGIGGYVYYQKQKKMGK